MLCFVGHFKKYTKERSSGQICCFIFKSFVAVAVIHNAANGLYIVSSGDVKQSVEWKNACCTVMQWLGVSEGRPLDVPREALHQTTLEPNLSTCCLARM